MKSIRLHSRGERGSILIVAMLLAALNGISLATYIKLNINSLRLSNRSFYANAAMNLAESGVEEAIWAFNQATAGSATAWSDQAWAGAGAGAHNTFGNFTFSANTTGEVRVYVDNINPTGNIQPIVVAKATITLPNNEGTIDKYVEVKLRRRSLFATGLVAKDYVDFNGNNAAVDSWNSEKNDDGTPRGSPVDYSAAVRHDRGSVGTVNITSTVDVQNADIYGTASVGGPSTSAIDVGPNGRVGPFGTAAGVKDPNAVATDFTANMEVRDAPSGGAWLGSVPGTLGAAGETRTYRALSITDNLLIQGNVTLVLTAPAGTQAIALSGNHDGITLAAGASLTIYTAGDIDLTGQGVANPNGQPKTFQIYGTSTSAVAQDIKIAGNGALKGVVFAPNASISIRGNGDVMGSMVGKTITLVGNALFHYDESLADLGGNNPYGVVRWRELSSQADRNGYAAELTF